MSTKSSSLTEIRYSRDGRHLSIHRSDSTLCVYRLTSSFEPNLTKPNWQAENVNSSVWHHEQSKILFVRKNGELGWKSFTPKDSESSGLLMTGDLLKILIIKRLDFVNLKSTRCLAFQRDFCVLQTSARQIVGLQWKSDQNTEVIWALDIGEHPVWAFCDKLYLNFEPHSRSLHYHSIFDGSIKEIIELKFKRDSWVRKLVASPDGRKLALLTDEQLLIGKLKLEVLPVDSKRVTDFAIGTEFLSVSCSAPGEYLVFNSKCKKIHCISIADRDVVVFTQHYNRPDKLFTGESLRPVIPEGLSDCEVLGINVRASLLSGALSCQHLESTANVLKIAEHCEESETCQILAALDDFIQKSPKPHTCSAHSSFGDQTLALALGFAGRSLRKFPSCAAIFNFIYKWQQLVTLPPGEPFGLVSHPFDSLRSDWDDLDDAQVLKDALVRNVLPLAQQFVDDRSRAAGTTGTRYASLEDVRRTAVRAARDAIAGAGHDVLQQAIDQAETIIRHSGCDAEDVWLCLLSQAEDRPWRDKLAEVLRRRQLLDDRLAARLDFVNFVQEFHAANVLPVVVQPTRVTVGTVSAWDEDRQRLYLAELFIHSKSADLLDRIRPLDVWRVLLDKQILSSLRHWIEKQCSRSGSADEDVPYVWPIDDAMIEAADRTANAETRESVLNLLAVQGIFSRRERSDLIRFIRRVHSIDRMDGVEELMALPTSNVSVDDVTSAVVDYCSRHFRPELFYRFLDSQHVLRLDGRPLWMQWIAAYQTWLDGDRRDIHQFLDLCRLNVAFLSDAEGGQPPEEFWKRHPFVALSFHLNGDAQVSDEVIRQAVASIPLLGSILNPAHPAATVYDLLDGEIPVDFRKFLSWRDSDDRNAEFPHFGHPDLCRQHGNVQKLNWTFQLKQGRPFDAFRLIQAEETNKEDRCLYPFAILAVALDDPFNQQVTQAAILLTTMLGFDSAPLRITLSALDLVAEPDGGTSTDLSRSLLTDENAARTLKSRLESVMLSQPEDDPVRMVDRWRLVVTFCALYGLERPVELLHRCARDNRWLPFTLFAHRFDYPLDVCLRAAERFEEPALRTHMMLALRADELPDGSESSDVYQTLFQVMEQADRRNLLLEAAFRRKSVELTVVTAVLEHSSVFQCLCLYLYLNLKEKPAGFGTQPQDSSPETLSLLLHSALSGRQFTLVLQSFRIFVPTHPLARLLDWLESFCRGRTDPSILDHVRDSLTGGVLARADEEAGSSFFRDPAQLVRLCMQILTGTLCCIVLDTERQLELVSHLCSARLFELAHWNDSDGFATDVPDFDLILQLLQLSMEAGIRLELDKLLQGNCSSVQFRTECQRAVQSLLERRMFEAALKFASLTDLPADVIFVTQLAAQFDSERHHPAHGTLRYRLKFWSRCDQLLTAHRVQAEIASRFFRDSIAKSASHWESHRIAYYALQWLRKLDPSPPDAAAELEALWWKFRIQAELSGMAPAPADPNVDPPIPQDATGIPLLRDKLLSAAGVANYPHPPSAGVFGPEFEGKVAELIQRDLDQGNCVEALQLCAIFGHRSRDLDLVLLAVDVAEGNLNVQAACRSLAETLPECAGAEFKDRQPLIDHLASLVKHGRDLCQRISVYCGVASTLDLQYDYLVEHSRPVCILKMLLETPSGAASASSSALSVGIGGHLSLARLWVTASRIPAHEVVGLVRDELTEAARTAHAETSGLGGSDPSNGMVVSLLRGKFNRLVTLCSDHTGDLGLALLDAALEHERDGHQDAAMVVELLIFAHCSFTLACDVENIGLILNRARLLVDRLRLDKQWHLITRLLTGIQRYTEMNYVFALLKDNDQFEYLLRKGMDRLPLLRLALLDFLRPNCVENRELFRLVALHFHMHAEVAAMWQDEADAILNPIVGAAESQVGGSQRKSLSGTPAAANRTPTRRPTVAAASPTAPLKLTPSAPDSPWKSMVSPAIPAADGPPPPVPLLRAGAELKQSLKAAMHNTVHAAEYYLQAGKLSHAAQCALRAELMALQIHLVDRASGSGNTLSVTTPSTSQVYCILRLEPAQVNQLIVEYFTYPEAEIVARAYGCPVAWGKALTHHFVLNNRPDYLEAFGRRNAMGVALVEEAIAAFETAEPSRKMSAEQTERLATLVSMLSDAEAKYRIASRLGLRSMVRGLLSSSGLPYLKDSAWKTANQN